MTPFRAAAPPSPLATAQQLFFTVESLGDRYRFVDPDGRFVALTTRTKHRLRNAVAWLGASPAAIGLALGAGHIATAFHADIGTRMLILPVTFLITLLVIASLIHKSQEAHVFADEAGTELVASFKEPSFGAFTFNKFTFHDESGTFRCELNRVNTRTGQQWQLKDAAKNLWLYTSVIGSGLSFTIHQGNQVVAGSTSVPNRGYSLDLRSDPHATVDRRVLVGLTALVHATNQILV